MYGVDFNTREGGEVGFSYLDRKSARSAHAVKIAWQNPILARSLEYGWITSFFKGNMSISGFAELLPMGRNSIFSRR